MAIPLLDLEGLARACIDGDLEAFAGAGSLGWTLTEAGREALLHALANTNYHGFFSYGVSALTLAQAIGLICEAAHNESGIAITEQVRVARLGKEIAIAFRHAGQVHFGLRYASNLPMNPGHLWPELKPWFKALERNRKRLETWVEAAEGLVSVPLAERVEVEGGRSGDELLAAVIAEPDEVAHRLVYADWLSARGDARGELIQLCEHRRTLAQPDEALDAKIRKLEAEYGERIAGEVAQLASNYRLARGFVTRVEMSAPSFAKHGARLLAAHPIDELELKPVNAKALARLARAPALLGLRGLRIGQIIGKTRPMPFDDLCASSLFESLRRLEIWTWVSEGDPHDAFARWAAPQLEALMLYEVDSAARIIAGLARNEVVRLRSLSVNLRARVAWEPVLSSPAFERLEALRLGTRGVRVGRLFEDASLPALTLLSVEDGFPIERIAFPGLRRLRLHGPISARAFARLLELHPRLEALQVWEIAADQIDAVLEHALALPSDHPLAALALPTRRATPELADAIARRFARSFYERDE